MDVRYELNRTGGRSKFEPFWGFLACDNLSLRPLCLGSGLPDRAWEELDGDITRPGDALADHA